MRILMCFLMASCTGLPSDLEEGVERCVRSAGECSRAVNGFLEAPEYRDRAWEVLVKTCAANESHCDTAFELLVRHGWLEHYPSLEAAACNRARFEISTDRAGCLATANGYREALQVNAVHTIEQMAALCARGNQPACDRAQAMRANKQAEADAADQAARARDAYMKKPRAERWRMAQAVCKETKSQFHCFKAQRFAAGDDPDTNPHSDSEARAFFEERDRACNEYYRSQIATVKAQAQKIAAECPARLKHEKSRHPLNFPPPFETLSVLCGPKLRDIDKVETRIGATGFERVHVQGYEEVLTCSPSIVDWEGYMKPFINAYCNKMEGVFTPKTPVTSYRCE